MRNVLREYNYDWRFWGILDNASKMFDATEKEFKHTAAFIPSFSATTEKLASTGPAGIKLVKATARYMENILHARERGKKLALITYNFSPAVLFAFDIVPIASRGCRRFMRRPGPRAFTRASTTAARSVSQKPPAPDSASDSARSSRVLPRSRTSSSAAHRASVTPMPTPSPSRLPIWTYRFAS